MNLYEGPVFIIFFGVVCLFMCILLFCFHDKKIWGAAGVVVLGVFSAWYAIERSVQTDNEKIHAMLQEMVVNAKNQNNGAILDRFEPKSNAHNAVKSLIDSYKVVSGDVSSIKVELNKESKKGDRTALLKFIAIGKVGSKNGSTPAMPGRIGFEIQIRRIQGGMWKAYEIKWKLMGKNQPWRSL